MIFHTPLTSDVPIRGPRRKIAISFGAGKLEWWGYQTMEKFEDMFNRLDSIAACDRRTDRQTSCDGIIRAMYTRCAAIT